MKIQTNKQDFGLCTFGLNEKESYETNPDKLLGKRPRTKAKITKAKRAKAKRTKAKRKEVVDSSLSLVHRYVDRVT